MIYNSKQLNEQCPYATPDELDYLRELAKTFPDNACVVMIGAGPGVMAIALLEGNKNLDLSIVDIESYYYAKRHIDSYFGILENVSFYLAPSEFLGRVWSKRKQENKIDLLIVDGDHSYEGVSEDIKSWLGNVKEDGLIFFHDYDATGTQFENVVRYPGVKQAIEEHLVNYANSNSSLWIERTRVGTSIVFQVNCW